MPKYFGAIGYATTSETAPGVWTETMVERNYYGDIIRNVRRLRDPGKVNDDVTISNELSIVVDPFAAENFHAMRYATYLGTKWKIESIDVQFPRVTLTLGGVYNA